MNDRIQFKIVHREDDGESNPYGTAFWIAEIYINGTELIDLLKPIEQPYCDQEGKPHLAGNYGYIMPKKLQKALLEAGKEDSYEAKYGVALLCCGGCGDIGCWSVNVHIREDDCFVYWDKMEHSHRAWVYDLSYRFEKEAYYEAVKGLMP